MVLLLHLQQQPHISNRYQYIQSTIQFTYMVWNNNMTAAPVETPLLWHDCMEKHLLHLVLLRLGRTQVKHRVINVIKNKQRSLRRNSITPSGATEAALTGAAWTTAPCCWRGAGRDYNHRWGRVLSVLYFSPPSLEHHGNICRWDHVGGARQGCLQAGRVHGF